MDTEPHTEQPFIHIQNRCVYVCVCVCVCVCARTEHVPLTRQMTCCDPCPSFDPPSDPRQAQRSSRCFLTDGETQHLGPELPLNCDLFVV